MNLRKLSLSFSLLLLTAAAHAQLGVYGTATVERMSNIAYTDSNSSSTSAHVDPVGGTFGAYYDLKSFGPIRLGADLRGNVLTTKRGAFAEANGFGAHIYSLLGGVRATVRVPKPYIHPYVQGSLGMGRTNFGIQYNLTDNFEYHGFIGADITIAPFIDWRVVELGTGMLVSNSPTARNYPLNSISTGFIFHLPR
jgi:hypothetical protein